MGRSEPACTSTGPLLAAHICLIVTVSHLLNLNGKGMKRVDMAHLWSFTMPTSKVKCLFKVAIAQKRRRAPANPTAA